MDPEQIAIVREQMNERTRVFLNEFTTNLNRLFDIELATTYLTRMDSHLNQFYEDVNSELDQKEESLNDAIEGLINESEQLKTALNTQFEIARNVNNEPLAVYRDRLDADLAEMREMYAVKKRKIDECLSEQEGLCQELGEEPRSLPTDPLATDEEVSSFELYLVDLKAEKLRRTNEIEFLQRKINELCDSLEVTTSESVYDRWSPKMENLNRLRMEASQLEKRRESFRRELDGMIHKLKVLWEFLDVSQGEREKFKAIAENYTQKSVDTVAAELKRCKAKKQENIKSFIEKLRARLVAQWDKIHKSQEERDRFEFFRSQTYTEDLYQLHELELQECERFYEDNREIFEKFAERQILFEKKKALDAKQNEPGRYNNRGGQLLKEEKERKQLDMKIPKVENEIRALVEGYRQTNNCDFQINGQCILFVMEKEWEDYRGSKELLKSARKATATTPNRTAIVPKTPMSLRGQTTMKRMASTTNLAMSTGNAAKKRHVDLSSNVSSIQRVNASSARLLPSNTKRNLLSQLNSEFAKPTVASVRPNRVISTLRVPGIKPKRPSLANLSANKILKKYRRSLGKNQEKNFNRISGVSSTDESLMNYDAFENNIKTASCSNSSVIEPNENNNTEPHKSVTAHRTLFKKPTEIAKPSSAIKSPLRPYNKYTMKVHDVVDLV